MADRRPSSVVTWARSKSGLWSTAFRVRTRCLHVDGAALARERGPFGRRPRALAGKRVVLGVCGGIAAYKAVEVCRRLGGCRSPGQPRPDQVGHRFVGPLTFSALAAEPARTSLFGSEDAATRRRGTRRARAQPSPTSSSAGTLTPWWWCPPLPG